MAERGYRSKRAGEAVAGETITGEDGRYGKETWRAGDGSGEKEDRIARGTRAVCTERCSSFILPYSLRVVG